MSFRNSVTIVASPRPRVGKTLLARLLTDFHHDEGRTVTAFDLNVGERTLAQFLPEYTKYATISDIKGQMALFDRLVADDGANKVIDLGDQAFESFVTVAARIGFAEEARRRGIAPVMLFVITPDPVAADAFRQLRHRLPNVALAPLHNDMLGASQYRDKYPVRDAGVVPVRIPALALGLRKYIDKPPFSFSQSRLANAKDIPLDAHIELQRWLRKVHLEFRELDLRTMLAEVQSSIRLK